MHGVTTTTAIGNGNLVSIAWKYSLRTRVEIERYWDQCHLYLLFFFPQVSGFSRKLRPEVCSQNSTWITHVSILVSTAMTRERTKKYCVEVKLASWWTCIWAPMTYQRIEARIYTFLQGKKLLLTTSTQLDKMIPHAFACRRARRYTNMTLLLLYFHRMYAFIHFCSMIINLSSSSNEIRDMCVILILMLNN